MITLKKLSASNEKQASPYPLYYWEINGNKYPYDNNTHGWGGCVKAGYEICEVLKKHWDNRWKWIGSTIEVDGEAEKIILSILQKATPYSEW